VILGSGPGSYTGLRVAQAYALGLASAWGGTALLGVSSLAGMVPLDRAGRWLVATDAGRGRFYSAAYAVGSGHLTCLAAEAKREEGELRQLEAELGLQLAQATFPSGLALLELAELGLGRAPPQLQYL
jgi:tRNA A37 threonylcarbamoyladenosine modification protein TsaB